jgi:hypothetical protein
VRRRRYARFHLTDRWTAEFRTFHDVTIDRCDGSGIWITSTEPLRATERVTVAFDSDSGQTLEADVAETMPLVQGGGVCQRACLRPAAGERRRMHGADARSATLWRRMAAAVIEVSRRGALLEMDCSPVAGHVGRLYVEGLNHVTFEDAVRVAWCQTREGGRGVCRAGVELLPASHTRVYAAHRSLRDLLTLMGTDQAADRAPSISVEVNGPDLAFGGGETGRRTGTRRWRNR